MKNSRQRINVFWFRRDLRLSDNVGLQRALSAGLPVLPIFIFDAEILNKLPSKNDARITFIYQRLLHLYQLIKEHEGNLRIELGRPLQIFQKLLQEYQVAAVFTNNDYEPYARKRDQTIKELLAEHGASFYSFKDQVIFEKGDVLKPDGLAYTVFTPYMKRWKAAFYAMGTPPIQTRRDYNFLRNQVFEVPSLAQIGFKENRAITFPKEQVDMKVLHEYHKLRDFPAVAGTSKLGLHLRFGTISIRNLVQIASKCNEAYLNELIWREFYMMILWHFPQVVDEAFKPACDQIPWQNNVAHFEAWCQGQTGYPIVDAGMRELNETGYMHNRLRMVTASFLTKHLLIDWRWGEAYFAEKLLDFELASNNGGWQWAASSGCDAAPYFRIFNPLLQAQKFDANQEYVKKWVPEVNLPHYPSPIVDHAQARARAIVTYKESLTPT